MNYPKVYQKAVTKAHRILKRELKFVRYEVKLTRKSVTDLDVLTKLRPEFIEVRGDVEHILDELRRMEDDEEKRLELLKMLEIATNHIEANYQDIMFPNNVALGKLHLIQQLTMEINLLLAKIKSEINLEIAKLEAEVLELTKQHRKSPNQSLLSRPHNKREKIAKLKRIKKNLTVQKKIEESEFPDLRKKLRPVRIN